MDMAMSFLSTFVAESWKVFVAVSPYLIFGFLVAGCLSVLISPAWIEKHLGGSGVAQVLKATLFGIPLPLCSCGVIPVSASLRQHGAGRPATTAFLLSTPQTGVDSVAITWGQLGPFIAIFRPLVALVTGFLGGMLTAIFDPEPANVKKPPLLNVIQGDVPEAASSSTQTATGDAPKEGRVWRSLHYGLYTLPRDIGRQLLIGILLAGLIGALIPEGALESLQGFKGMLVAMAIGIPLYTCATSSTPIALGLMMKGVSPGAALVFLITGPATNTASLATLWKVLGKRTTLIYLATVAIGGLGAGLALDAIFAANWVPTGWGPDLTPASQELTGHEGHGMEGLASMTVFDWVSALVMMGILVFALCPKLKRANDSSSHGHAHAHDSDQDEHSANITPTDGLAAVNQKESIMQKIRFSITGMRCEGCVTSVTGALRESRGVQEVQVDLAAKEATVRGEGMDTEKMSAAIVALGFEVEVGGNV